MSEPKRSIDVENLKQNWLADPCWDIEKTEGFENYEKELRLFRLRRQKELEEYEAKRKAEKCLDMTISEELLNYLEYLERKIDKMTDEVDKLREMRNE